MVVLISQTQLMEYMKIKGKLFMGVDPGKHGAWSVIDKDRNIIEVFDMPMIGKDYDKGAIMTFLNKYKSNVVAVICERQQSMGKGSGRGVMEIGRGYGIITMAMFANDLVLDEVIPSVWKKDFTLIKKGKEESIVRCLQLFPKADLKLSPRHKKLSDDRAESLLLAELCRRRYDTN